MCCACTEAPDFQEAEGESDEEYEPEEILKERVRKKKPEYLVKWLGYQISESTWELPCNIASCSHVIDSWKAKAQKKVGQQKANETKKQENSKKRAMVTHDVSRHKRANGKRVVRSTHQAP